MRSIAFASIVSVVLASPAAADVRVSVKNEHYEISGRNGAALLDAMDRSGPKHGFLARAIAQTRYSVSWEIDWVRAKGGCRVAGADAVLSITYMYPKVKGAVAADLQRRWGRFLAGVRKHEEVHGKIARDMVLAAEKALTGLSVKGDGDCRKIKAEVKRRVDRIYAKYEAMQVKFDDREHGDGGNVEGLVAGLLKSR